MEVKTRQAEGKPLTITIEYPKLDLRTRKLIRKIQSLDLVVNGSRDGRIYPINHMDIFYIETVERKTFLYTESEVYMTEKKLYELEVLLKDTGIIRISKSCLMNMDMLYSVRQLINSQLEATLINGEKLIVARTYLQNIKRMLREEI